MGSATFPKTCAVKVTSSKSTATENSSAVAGCCRLSHRAGRSSSGLVKPAARWDAVGVLKDGCAGHLHSTRGLFSSGTTRSSEAEISFKTKRHVGGCRLQRLLFHVTAQHIQKGQNVSS